VVITEPTLQWADLARVFTPKPGAAERVGIEVEIGLVDPVTGCSIPYVSARALLESLIREFGGSPIRDGDHLVGVGLPGGASFTLETGGALEYSSAPSISLAEVARQAETALRHAAEVARGHGIALLSGGCLPFTPKSRIPWIPKPRVQAMRDYFRGLGEAGRYADEVMGLVLSTQASLDYLSAGDFLEKTRLHILASPVAAALFVNSPLADGHDWGVQSRRMQFWTRFEPRRCGVLGFMLQPGAGPGDLVEWAAGLNMIYRRQGGSHVAAPHKTFGEALASGYGDGTWPEFADWQTHLCQTWPDVRVRHTLELRACDGLHWPYFTAAPALWAGLTYHAESRRKAIELLAELTPEDLAQTTDDVAVKGLAAMAGPWLVRELATELLKLARQGLCALVAAGREPAVVTSWLDPLDEVAELGETFADRTLTRWAGDLGRRPSAYVAAYRISSD
jgi:glutamate--cysteine ligase